MAATAQPMLGPVSCLERHPGTVAAKTTLQQDTAHAAQAAGGHAFSNQL